MTISTHKISLSIPAIFSFKDNIELPTFAVAKNNQL